MVTKRVDMTLPGLRDLRRYWQAIAIGGGYGTGMGAVPGVGAEASPWMAYATVRNKSRHPEQFGTGTPEGVLAPEATNNANTGGTMIPMLSLGIPGDGSTAIMLGAMILQNVEHLREVSEVVRHHHEKWDGTGYPHRLKGEEIPLAAFTRDVDPITREIIEHGGLFEYNVARLQGKVRLPVPAAYAAERPAPEEGMEAGEPVDPEELRVRRGAGEPAEDARVLNAAEIAEQVIATSQPNNPPVPAAADAPVAPSRRRGMTIAEKIFAAHWVVDAARGVFGVPVVQAGDSGFVRTDIRFSHEYVTPMAAIFFEEKLGPDAKVTDPASIIMFRDHLTYLHQVMPPERVQLGLLDVARQLEVKQREFAAKQGIKLYGERLGARLGSEAICHSKILETYAEPGRASISRVAARARRIGKITIAATKLRTRRLIGMISRMNSRCVSCHTRASMMFGVSPHAVLKPPRLLATSMPLSRPNPGAPKP